jgi:preprotein translocase subunit YajC
MEKKKDTKKPLFALIILFNVVMFFVSPKKKRQKTEAISMANPPFLFGTAFSMEY